MSNSCGRSDGGAAEARVVPIRTGPFVGEIVAAYADSDLIAALGNPDDGVADSAPAGGDERHRIAVIQLSAAGRPVPVAVKSFGRQSLLKDVGDRIRGTKAKRSWRTAGVLQRHGVGTPPPVAYLERWEGLRLRESHYLSEYQDNVASFRNELIRLYRHDPICEKVMALLQCVAGAVRRLHAAGVAHRDLGNQNILLRRRGDGAWGDVQFVDLNRSVAKPALSFRDRARDLSRMTLPSDFLRVFKEMYFEGEVPPEFERWERLFRRAFAAHTRTRRLRHPFRWPPPAGPETVYPDEKDIWIWDERSGQAISTLKSRDRRRYYPTFSDSLRVVSSVASGFGPVISRYRALKARCYADEVALDGRIGVALRPHPAGVDRELGLLEELGAVPVLLHFHHHESPREWNFLAQTAQRLHARGHRVAIGLVQDRRAVQDSARWRGFVKLVLEQTHNVAEWVEVGHAVNRVKWGIWKFSEYVRLLEAAAAEAGRYPSLKLMGPAVIDFEYHYLLALLRLLPRGFRFDALSHHLHVDRRGVPENRQDGFSAEEKFVLARAIANWSSGCDDRLIVSEVSWPLSGTGVYSPVGSPYVSPGVRFNDPSVTEEQYADYMIRYLATAVCSGMVERVYWWRLVARGFGLVDDARSDEWRRRPAFDALRVFLAGLGGATFVRKIASPPQTSFLLFRCAGGRRMALAWAWNGEATVQIPFPLGELRSRDGNALPVRNGGARLSEHPVYLLEAE